jgi:DNA-binding transcriptional LysR family regulator
MPNIDLKLLAIIDDLYRTHSVSQTAENLGLNQPTISMSLARLRKYFNDPLFVRTASGMEPTPHSEEIIKLLRGAHELLQMALGHHVVFDSCSSDRTFRISTTDMGQVVILPTLMNRLQKTAPLVRLELRNVTANTPGHLESGDVDLALGFIPGLNAGFFRQKLFTEHFVCVVRVGHPRIKGRISLAQFQEVLHLVVTTAGTGHNIIERILKENQIQRKVGLRIPSFLELPTLITNTDLIATIPSRLAQMLATLGHVNILKLPFSVPPYSVMQHWHERFDRDMGNRWLRAQIASLFQGQQ